MEETEYYERLKKIEKDYEDAKIKLYIDYGMSKVIFQKGDIIKSDSCALIIDKITVSKRFGLPEPVYHGFELKKDLTPRKDKNRTSIFGNGNAIKLSGNYKPA